MEKERWRRLTEENLTAMECFARLLNADGALFDAREVASFAQDCGISREDALKTLLAAACGLKCDENAAHRRLMERYFSPALHPLAPEVYTQTPYYRTIRFPQTRQGRWRLTQLACAPYQIFPCGSVRLLPDGREMPALGYFEASFPYPAVLEDGREWMTVTPNEIETMREGIAAARGKTAVFGLGLGYFAFMASLKEAVASVDIIERDPCLISLFEEKLLPQFPQKKKIRLLQTDAFDYLAGPMTRENYDFAFIDLWHDVSDGLPMYLRCRRLERLSPQTEFSYWIEQDMLIFLRGLIIEDWLRDAKGLERFIAADGEPPAPSRVREIAPEILEAEIAP